RDAFRLYDTFGFPLDLTDVICAERGLSVDHAGYDAALAEARERSEFKSQDQAVESGYREAPGKVPPQGRAFSAYETDEAPSRVVALVKGGALAERASAGDDVEVVTEATPFYGEAGGQVGDLGVIRSASGLRIAVSDTQKPLAGLVVHRGKIEAGS